MPWRSGCYLWENDLDCTLDSLGAAVGGCPCVCSCVLGDADDEPHGPCPWALMIRWVLSLFRKTFGESMVESDPAPCLFGAIQPLRSVCCCAQSLEVSQLAWLEEVLYAVAPTRLLANLSHGVSLTLLHRITSSSLCVRDSFHRPRREHTPSSVPKRCSSESRVFPSHIPRTNLASARPCLTSLRTFPPGDTAKRESAIFPQTSRSHLGTVSHNNLRTLSPCFLSRGTFRATILRAELAMAKCPWRALPLSRDVFRVQVAST